MNLGLQEPPKDPMIYNRRQADGNFRSLAGFWERENRMTKTAQVLKAMLVENTGTHMLDSGGAYGRAWQQNQGRDFNAEPAATISVEEEYIDIRRSTFHFLNECLEFDQAMTEQLYDFAKAEDADERAPWLILMEMFVEEAVEARGIYGEGKPQTVNTYNQGSLLREVLQYIYFEIDEKGYVLLQLGCNLHEAYTAPKAFRCNIESSPSIFDDGRATITCKGSHRWYYSEGEWNTGHIVLGPWETENRELTEFPIMAMGANYHKVLEKGRVAEGNGYALLWQDAEGVHCPLCGGILEVW